MDAYCDLLRIAGAVQNAALVLLIAGMVSVGLAFRTRNYPVFGVAVGSCVLASVVGLLGC